MAADELAALGRTMGAQHDPLVERALALSVLRDVPPDVLERLLADSMHVDVPAGGVIRRGEQPPWCGLVASGVMRCVLSAADGREMSKLYVREGYLAGAERVVDAPPAGLAQSLVARGDQPFRVEAVTDATVLMLNAESLRGLARSDVSVALAIVRQLTWTLDETIRLLALTAFGTVRQRLAWRLLELASSEDDRLVTLPLTQQALADAVGSRREVVGRILGAMRRAGIIALNGGRIEIRDPDRLASEASAVR